MSVAAGVYWRTSGVALVLGGMVRGRGLLLRTVGHLSLAE